MPATPAASPSGANRYPSCRVCSSQDRYEIELAYMTGERRPVDFTRAQVERHMAHVSEPEALKIALGMSAAVALAARLRYLESQATQILDASMGEDGSPALALKAIREVRATIELMGRVAGSLVDRVQVANARPDLDEAIADALRMRGVAEPVPNDDPKPEPERQYAALEQLALPPAPDGSEGREP
jgi:hypothetical protein